ncbi:MAG: fold metallo-hydrolase [Frondihabitans sp.]|nr:fold metallo-hydrolase [Frondihabitans sp.]
MQLTKYAHATVTLENDSKTLLLDPGVFAGNAADLLATADAVLITHDHADHFDKEPIVRALDARPELVVYGPETIVEALDRGDQVVAVHAGDQLIVAGFDVAAFGEKHATIHADIPVTDNVGYLVNGKVFHPGDAYLVPGVEVETLLVPTSGPWAKLSEAVDYVREVKPARLVQIHEALLSEIGQQSTATMLGEQGLTGIPMTLLAEGESLAV